MNYSVVMPVYLREKEHESVVQDTIQSVVAAGGYDEFILVDDGSPLSYDVPLGITVINQPNMGISEAWNKGKSVAKGKYVAIINDDIRVPLGWLDRLATCFLDDSCGVSGPLIGGPYHTPQHISNTVVENKKFFPGYCFMIQRDRFFEDFDPQFTTNCGDVDYWHRIELEGLKLLRAGISIYHKEGDVLGHMNYDTLSKESLALFEKKWGFNPQEKYYS